MFIPYSNISDNSKVWIYQSDREISIQEINEINQQLKSFCDQWTSHGKPVKSSFKLFGWFLCFFVDELTHITSGCSIDSSVTLIKSIQNQYKIDFFKRTNIAFLYNNKTRVVSFLEFKKYLHLNILVYNNLVKTKDEFEKNWLIPLKDSWLNKHMI